MTQPTMLAGVAGLVLAAAALSAAHAGSPSIVQWSDAPLPVSQVRYDNGTQVCGFTVGSPDLAAPHVHVIRNTQANVVFINVELRTGQVWQTDAPITLTIDGVTYTLPPSRIVDQRSRTVMLDIPPYSPGRQLMHALWNGTTLTTSFGDSFPLAHSAVAMAALTKCADAISGQESLASEASVSPLAPGPVVIPPASQPQQPSYAQQPGPVAQPAVTAPGPVMLADDGHGDLKLDGIVNGSAAVSFVLDTGAATVTLPKQIIARLMREGSLTLDDFVNATQAILADGSRVPTKVFRLRSLTIGGYTATNVLCSDGPEGSDALLGQSFLKNFRSYSVDNEHRVLRLG